MNNKIKVLISESENLIANDLRRILSKAGYIVVAIASTGEDAIEKVKEYKPDIVILDVFQNGEIDGKSTAKLIKEFSKARIMFYSTCWDISTYAADQIYQVQLVDHKKKIHQKLNKGWLDNSSKLLFNSEDEKQIISNVENVISIKNEKQGLMK